MQTEGNDFPPLKKGRCERIQSKEEKAFPVVRGRGKFTPPKPAGDRWPQSTYPASAERRRHLGDILNKDKRVLPLVKAGSVPCRPRRNQRLFWRREFAPSPRMPRPSNFPRPELFHSFRGIKGDFWDSLQIWNSSFKWLIRYNFRQFRHYGRGT
jgi:hypothetical protein